MILRWIESEGFRNLQPGRVEFGPGVNLLWGENGAGKSNLLESVYFLLTTRSFRTSSSSDLPAVGREGFRLIGELEGSTGHNLLEVTQGGGQRSILLDGKRVGLEEVLRRCSVLAFSTSQMSLFRGGPRDRRRFLDRGILALRPAYLRELGEYFRTLAQRNRLLKEAAGAAERAAWDERFIAAAVPVTAARRDFAARLQAEVGRCAEGLVAGESPIRLRYRPRLARQPEKGDRSATALAQALRDSLAGAAEAERRLRHSLYGPHRDDLGVFAGERDLVRYGSAGQQRTALLALKLTRMELYREQHGAPPLLLVDDMDSDLDDATAERLMDRAGGYQAMVSTCKQGSRERHGAAARVFRVRGGEIVPVDVPVRVTGVAEPADGAL